MLVSIGFCFIKTTTFWCMKTYSLCSEIELFVGFYLVNNFHLRSRELLSLLLGFDRAAAPYPFLP